MTKIKTYILKLIEDFQAQQARVIDENQLRAPEFMSIANKLSAAFNQYKALEANASQAHPAPLLSQLSLIKSEIDAVTTKLDRIDSDLLTAVAKKDSSEWRASVTAMTQGNGSGLFNSKQTVKSPALAVEQDDSSGRKVSR